MAIADIILIAAHEMRYAHRRAPQFFLPTGTFLCYEPTHRHTRPGSAWKCRCKTQAEWHRIERAPENLRLIKALVIDGFAASDAAIMAGISPTIARTRIAETVAGLRESLQATVQNKGFEPSILDDLAVGSDWAVERTRARLWQEAIEVKTGSLRREKLELARRICRAAEDLPFPASVPWIFPHRWTKKGPDAFDDAVRG